MSEPSFENPCLGRVVAGARPRGSIHIGELVGAVESWVRLQDHYECVFIIADADIHNNATNLDIPDKREIYEMLADWLAAGISPNNSIITLESAIPERLKLAELLTTHMESSYLPKDGSGLLLSETLEAVAMLLFKADAVPLTEDQPKSSLEIARNLGLTINQKYGDVFPGLKAKLLPESHLLGLDGRPMQRSFDNLILLKELDEETELKIETASLDTLIMYTTRFDQDLNRANAVAESFTAGLMSEKELRRHVTASVNNYLHSARVKRDKWIANPGDLESILQLGARRARAIASETIAQVSRIISRT